MTSLENRPRTALLVIDVQNGVVGSAFERDRVIANIQTLVDKARAEHVPVLWVQHSDDGLPRGSEGWEYVPELKRLDTEPLVHKTYGDSFEATDLEELLAERSVGPVGGHRCADGGVHPLDPARCVGARLRRDPRLRRTQHRGHARVGVPGHPGTVDRLHQRLLELGEGARPQGHRGTHRRRRLLGGVSAGVDRRGQDGMSGSSRTWQNTTHDWARTVDAEHLAQVRQAPEVFAAGGTTHLILEVLAYAADEAEWTGTIGRCRVILHADGSVSVADNGRGTDTRPDARDQPVKKPVMATRDLRFFDSPDAQQLPDGRPRRGVSVVAALSPWLVHTNRRRNGGWTQRYEHGIPVTGLLSIPDQDTTGTTVHFLAADSVRSMQAVSPSELRRLAVTWPQLAVEVIDERTT